MTIKLVVGLGNPGLRYSGTRHNIGFVIVDKVVERLRGTSWRAQGEALLSECVHQGERLWCMQPQTFMNLSGKAVAEWANFYKILPSELLVIHDEIDIPLGDIRIKIGGGDGGHNGIKSIASSVSSIEFMRLRAGVGRPPPGIPYETAAWVLGRFGDDEKKVVEELVLRASEAAVALLTEPLTKVQGRFHKK